MQRLCGSHLVRRDHPRPETAGGIEVLALSDIELGVPRPLARGPFVAERVARDVLVRFFFRDPASFAADHQRDLAFIVELLRDTRLSERLTRADERAGRAEEHARIFRGLRAVLVLGVAVAVVHPDAED